MTIKFKKYGLDDERLNDIGNFRIMSEKFQNKNGEETILQFTLNAVLERKKNKKCIFVQDYVFKENGMCVGDIKFQMAVSDEELEYSLENVLKIVNRLSEETFTKIEFI